MPVAFIQEFLSTDGSTTNYDAVAERLNVQNDWPEGAHFHSAGWDGDVFRIFEVWETREQCERFQNERVMPLVVELAGEDAPPPDRQSMYELHGFNTA